MILMRMTKSEALNADSMGLAVGVLEIILFTQLLWQIIFGRFLLIHSYILLEKAFGSRIIYHYGVHTWRGNASKDRVIGVRSF